MKGIYGALLGFFILPIQICFAQCVINVTATGNPLVVCQGDQVQLNASVTPAACGRTAPCSGNNVSPTVGSGTINQPGSSFQSPTLLGNFTKSGRNQMLYLAAELNTALGGPCVLKTLTFNLSVFNSDAELQNFTLKLGCTTATSLTNWENNLTTVFYQATGLQPAASWNNSITLTVPFAWDGVSNLIVDVCWNNPITFGNQNNKAESTNTGFNSYLSLFANNDVCATATPPVISTIRPNVRFNFCYADINDHTILWTPNTGFNTVSNSGIANPTANPIVNTNYIITVSDTGGCIGKDTVTIQVDNSRVSAGADVSACSGNVTALSASLIGTIIPGPAAYTWSTLAGLNVGNTQSINVTPTVTTTYVVALSGGGCVKRDTVTVNISGLTVNATPTNVTCTNAANGKIKVTSNGTSPFSYVWSLNANTGNLDSAVSLAPGSYTVTVADVNGCSGSASAQITEPIALSFTSSVKDVTCFGGNNGEITITPSGGTGAYTYQWSNGLPSTPTVSSLQSGNYSVTVSDANLCSATNTISVSQPSQIVFSSPNISHVRCFGGSNGMITTNASGGTGIYTYSWSHNPGLNAATATNLLAGSYTVSITDASGCPASDSYIITQPASGITFNPATITPPTCFGGSNGTATVNPLGGVSPYSYSWSPSSQSTQTATGLSAQTYTVVVTDDSLCTASSSISISQPAQISITTNNITQVKCNGGSDGAIDINIANGVQPLSYLWSSGPTSQDIANIPVGNYSVLVTDNTSCTQSASFTITEPLLLILNSPLNITQVLCFGGNTGSITTNPSGGTPSYSYSWSPSGTTQTISSLVAGNYSVTVNDANACSVSAIYQITEPTTSPTFGIPAITDVLCNGLSTGAITVSVSGGTGSYNYSWNHASINSPSVSSLPAGSYGITVTDANGCPTSAIYTVNEPAAITFGTQQTTSVSCFGYSDGNAEVIVSGGRPPYSYTWNGTPGTNPQSGLAAGNYTVAIIDANSCTASITMIVAEPAAINVSLEPHNATCFGASNGYIDAFPTGGTPPFTFLWSNGSVYERASGLDADLYAVTVSDNSGCSASGDTSVGEPEEMIFSSIPTQVRCPGEQNGTIKVIAEGGTKPYNYAVTQDGSNFVFTTDSIVVGLASGLYTVILADNNGCTLQNTTFVPSPVPDIFDYKADSTSCYGSQYSDGAVHMETFTIQNTPYQFGVDGGPLSNSEHLYNLTAGTHVVNAVNYWGCATNITVFVPEPVEGKIEVYPTDTTIQLGESVQFTSSFSPYTASVITSYLWSPSEGLSCVDCYDPLVTTYSRSNQYTLTVNYNDHCVSTATLKVMVQDTLKVYIPNSFSPNGDGNNDEWLIYGEGIKTIDLKIFNRWGEKVFETSNQFAGWDGTSKGVLQDPSVFVYNVTITFLNDRKTNRVGSIMLLR